MSRIKVEKNIAWDDKRECFEAYREILSVLKPCKKPVLILIGNHDDNAYAAWNPNFSQKIISDYDWKKEILTPFATEGRVHDETDPNSKYYYFDFKKGDKTIRAFCLDAADYKTVYDESINGAYNRSRENISKILKENPSIQIVLDIHRDALITTDGVRLAPTTEQNGKNAAQKRKREHEKGKLL